MYVMRKLCYFSLIFIGFCLSSCMSSHTYPSIQKQYASQLAKVHPGMRPAAIKKILPIRLQGAYPHHRKVYVLRHTAGIHQTFADKTTKIFGVRAEDLPEMRALYFYFERGRFTHTSTVHPE
jgi:hypothetical protein